MFHLVLFEPEIPPNTGNIIRLCANSGATLHLIKPLGFTLNNTQLKRAGLDYHDLAQIQMHDSYADFVQQLAPPRIFACSTKGTTCYTTVNFRPQDALLLGPETRGLPLVLLNTFASDRVIYIPMQASNRSLNLSNAAAIVLYEAWRQQNFK